MARISLAGFKDPARRPRYIIWTGALVLGLATFTILAMGITSTRWFCANGCHKVQDDTIIAYERSTHSEISCMACHMPVNADPVTFTLHKAEALGELYLTVTNRYHLPLNPHSEVAKEMPEENCTQCHSMQTRDVTPSEGIVIDHEVHSEEGVQCTICHNRVAHREDFELTLEGNRKHEDFMEMDACFRCHSQESDGMAPGECLACHPEDFELKPSTHDGPNFVRDVGEDRAAHAVMAMEEFSRIESATAGGEPDEEGGHGSEHALEFAVARVEAVNNCMTCHEQEAFCSDCHGLEMPHPAGFVEGHGDLGEEKPKVCANCHSTQGKTASATGTEFCNGCHHQAGDPSKPWIPQHYGAVREQGAAACFDCHDPTFCAECHVRGISG